MLLHSTGADQLRFFYYEKGICGVLSVWSGYYRLFFLADKTGITELELPDIKEVREKTGLSQSEFAARLHISPRTLQNWEQGRRYPTGPAATLVRILNTHPSLISNWL